ncbi:MAG: CCA tRNA nucleotidyltransferase [Methanobacterium sp.]
MEQINFDKILKLIKSTDAENKKIRLLSNKLIKIINETAKDHKICAEAVLVGSVAKDTWLSGKADIDIFIKFPLSIDENDLKKNGMFLGHECIKKVRGIAEERYSTHPYVTGLIEEYEVDFVPCYVIEDSKQLKSAVDRTILHTEYVKKNLKTDKTDEVLLLKKFMESIGTYGSEFKVGGFSGYLCELLIIYYGSFLEVLKAASEKWHPEYIIDIEKQQTGKFFDGSLVVVDPVDEKRNVAAALTLQRMSEFVVASRNFLENPSEEYFFPEIPRLNVDFIKNEFEKRGTKTHLLVFAPPKVPSDAIHSQLKKTENSLKSIVKKEDFRVFGSDSWTDENKIAIILLEFDIWKLPIIKKHIGPYVWSKHHQRRFLKKYKKKTWIDGDRWVVEVERKYRDIESFFYNILREGEVDHLKFGKHIKTEILKHHVDIGEFLGSKKCNDAVLMFLYKYLNKNKDLWR